MNYLAVETSTNICSVCYRSSAGEVFEKRTERKGSHSELLFLFIRELMEEHSFAIADLDGVLISNGPGSYTGLRIAASAVKGLLFGTNVPVYTANTLASFATGVVNAEEGTADPLRIHTVINARRKHLYHQLFNYTGKELQALNEAGIRELTEVEEMLKNGDVISGTGTERLNSKEEVKMTDISDPRFITAASLIRLFESDNRADYFEETTAADLESEYISSSQVNNTRMN